MQRASYCKLAVGLLLLCCGGTLLASEVDELRQRAKAMRKEAAVMAERGKPEQAERLEKESLKLLAAAEQMERADSPTKKNGAAAVDKEVQHLKSRLQDLHAQEKKLRVAQAPEKELAEVREQITGTERELQTIHAHQAVQGKLAPEFHAHAEKLAAASRRIHHLRLAAQNLKMAEAHDLAQQLMNQAEAMEREVEEGKRQLAAEMQKVHSPDYGPDVVQQLKAEVERLRAEVKELRQQVERR